MSSNPAAIQGWVKSVDPNSGRFFYANHITRKTQWEPPPNWVEESSPAHTSSHNDNDGTNETLPGNWEVMHDPTTGKPFYVDHERKITQWTRPKEEKKPEKKISFAPASTTESSFSMQKFLQFDSVGNPQQETRSYSQEAAYYHQSHLGGMDVDFSDSLPGLDFSVKKVADKLRLNCPACDGLFTLSVRRHHCRLCGDVFCHNCSNNRVSLPLEGTEFEKPVRICNSCNEDVSRGNFFSMRRYLTPLQLFDPDDPVDEDPSGVTSPPNVNAALSSLTSDLDQMVQSAEGFDEKLTIPASILVPCVTKHLGTKHDTSDRAIRAIASLLSVGSMVGKNDYAYAIYFQDGHRTLNQILTILERSGSSRSTLFVQEKAAQAMFYLTESQILVSMMQTRGEFSQTVESDPLDSLDIQRTIRNMLDHSSVNKNPHLQRWATATIRNLILEDQRRACLAINEVAAKVASGESPGSLAYESILDQLVSTGGVMILCSLIGADDADTRAHATGALGAILTATRAIDGSMSALSEMTGGVAGGTEKKDGNIVRAIVAGGGCGSSVSQLLLSADNTVARMGCEFIGSLVLPLLIDPLGSATLQSLYDCRKDEGGLGACREAALEIASGSCLPAILSLVRENGRASRPIELRKSAMETLAATVLAVGEMGKAWADGKYEEGIGRNGAPAMLIRAIALLNEERVVDIALESLNSSSVQSLGSSRDTPSSRIREAAGTVLASLTSCSAEAIIELHSRQVLSQLLVSSDDTSMTAPSTLRGDAAPRCLGMLEAAASTLIFAWQHPSGAKSELLDRLMEALDAGTITHLFRVLTSKMDWESRDKSAGGMKARSAACRLLCCLFGIASTGDTSIGMKRLLDACDADQMGRRSSKGARNVLEAVLSVLQTALNLAHRVILGSTSRGAHYHAALLDLVDSSLLATGSMCGSSVAPGGGDGVFVKGDDFLVSHNDDFAERRKEVCKVACDVVIRSGRSGPALLPTLLVGGFGEGAVSSSLRLSLAIAQNGSKEQHMKLALSGILVPVSDILRAALSRGDLYRFSAALALVRFCGPHVAAGKGGGVPAIRDAIRVATNVLTLPVSTEANTNQLRTQESLKSECIGVLESLSGNASLWSTICTDALPAIVKYLRSCSEVGLCTPTMSETESSALRTVLEIVQVPSHAVAAAEEGLSTSLGKIMKKYTQPESSEYKKNLEIGLLAMETLHVLVKQPNARQHCDLLCGSALSSICSTIVLAASAEGKSTNETEDIIFFGLEVLSIAVSDIEESMDTAHVLQSSEAAAFLESILAEPRFVRCLCAYILPLQIEAHENEKSFYDVPLLYGLSPPVVNEACGGYQNSRECALFLLFTLSVYACAIESPQSESFWNTCLLRDCPMSRERDNLDVARASATFCSAYLQLLEQDHEAVVPSNRDKQLDYENLTRPLVRYRLLESLGESLSDLTEEAAEDSKTLDDYMLSLLVSYNLPCIFLSVWKDPALLELTYELMKMTVEANQEGVLHLFVKSKESVVSIFDLLNHKPDNVPEVDIRRIRQFLVTTLEKLAETGLLMEAVEKFGLKSSAIKALASACLSEDFVNKEEELTSHLLASGLIQCLVQLCTVKNHDKDGRQQREIVLTGTEAEAIALSLGRKICHMVISRYLERAKLQQYDLDEEEIVLNAPDVSLLCAMAQHSKAMKILESIGGLHALAQVAADGEPNALAALLEGSKGQPLLLLEADTYLSVLSLLSDEREHAWKNDAKMQSVVETGAFRLLSQLSDESLKGRRLIFEASGFEHSIVRAKEVLSSWSLADNSEIVDADDTKPWKYDSGRAENQMNLLIAALSYVATMTQVSEACSLFLDDEDWLLIVSNMASSGISTDLQIEALKAITSLSMCSSADGFLPTERVGEIFQGVLRVEHTSQIDGSSRVNELYSLATEGILCLFDSLPVEQQRSLVTDAALRYRKLLKSHTIDRTTKKGSSLDQGGLIAYNITSIIMIASYNSHLEDVLDSSLIMSLANTLQWRYDPKTAIKRTEQCSWDASVTQVLQILSRITLRVDSIFEKAGFSLQDLTEVVLMVAAPGKAPRQAISFLHALEEAQKVGEPASKLAARRIARTLKG
ncbi:unnamed protein product [Cylindrotheca closterium]|uniref:HECT-type E3 ubiquitin transferase n=1 Tax=Cylindrotheca closterium TaxID=2856 RepID=A0AAD2FYX4_9STRA|nr:unnamed protein product [Cylindrotheca closterium]